MSAHITDKTRKRIKELELEKKLLLLRTIDLQTNTRFSERQTREQEHNFKLIENSGKRLIEIENALSHNRNIIIQSTLPLDNRMFGLQRTPTNDKKDNSNEKREHSPQQEQPVKKSKSDKTNITAQKIPTVSTQSQQNPQETNPNSRESDISQHQESNSQATSRVSRKPPSKPDILATTSKDDSIISSLPKPNRAFEQTIEAGFPLSMDPNQDPTLLFAFEGPAHQKLDIPSIKYIPTRQEIEKNREKIENLKQFIEQQKSGAIPKTFQKSALDEYVNEPHPTKMRSVPRTVPRSIQFQSSQYTKKPSFQRVNEPMTDLQESASDKDINVVSDASHYGCRTIVDKPPLRQNVDVQNSQTVETKFLEQNTTRNQDNMETMHQKSQLGSTNYLNLEHAQLPANQSSKYWEQNVSIPIQQTEAQQSYDPQSQNGQNWPNYWQNLNNLLRENIGHYQSNDIRNFSRIPSYAQQERNPYNQIPQEWNQLPHAFEREQQNQSNRIARNSRNDPHHHEERARETFLRRLRMIPKFNGDSFRELRDFVDIVNTLYNSCFNQTEETELFEHIFLQLRGEAKQIALRHDDWPTIASALESHFAYLSNQEILISQLDNLHQEQKESLSEYAERARKLLRERNSTYSLLSEEQKREHNRTARKAFAKGLRENRLRERLLIRGASSLEDAIAYSIEAENDTATQVANNELFCRACRNIGHRERDCRRRTNDTNVINSFVSALRSFSINANRMPLNNRPMNLNNRNPNIMNRNNFSRPQIPNTQNANLPLNNRSNNRSAESGNNNRFNNQTNRQPQTNQTRQTSANNQSRQVNSFFYEENDMSDEETQFEEENSETEDECEDEEEDEEFSEN